MPCFTNALAFLGLPKQCSDTIGNPRSQLAVKTDQRKLETRAVNPHDETRAISLMKKILVIEDEPEMRRNLATILRLEKFRPLAAENGRIGVELAKKEKPDLIL